MASYICVIECSDNHVYICDTKKVQLEELIPLRIIGLYNVEQNYTLYKVFKKPVSRHLGFLEIDFETTRTDVIETIGIGGKTGNRRGTHVAVVVVAQDAAEQRMDGADQGHTAVDAGCDVVCVFYPAGYFFSVHGEADQVGA